MTDQEIIQFYQDLLIIQYIGVQQNRDMIEILVKQFIMDQLPLAVMSAYDIDTAVGVQLDVIGKYVGVTRTGFGFSTTITLDDDNFRILIRIAIIQNSFGSSLSDIQELLFQFFPDEILVFDYANMHMSYLISSTLGDQDLIQLFVNEGHLPKPMGVQLGATIYAPDIKSFFGCRTYEINTINNSPCNDYLDYHMDWPMLDYSYAIVSSLPANIEMTDQSGFNILQQDGGEILV